MSESNDAAAAWKADFESLPAGRREALKNWYGMQFYIAQELGLTPDQWMQEVGWAFEHPLDYSFIADFPEVVAAMGAGDGFEKVRSGDVIGSRGQPVVPSVGKEPGGSSVLDVLIGRTPNREDSRVAEDTKDED